MRTHDSERGLGFKYDKSRSRLKSRSMLKSRSKSPGTLNPPALMLTYRGHSSCLRFYTDF